MGHARRHLRLHPLLRPRRPRHGPLPPPPPRPHVPTLAPPQLVLLHLSRRPPLRNRGLRRPRPLRAQEPVQPHLLHPKLLLHRHRPRLPRGGHLRRPLRPHPPPRPPILPRPAELRAGLLRRERRRRHNHADLGRRADWRQAVPPRGPGGGEQHPPRRSGVSGLLDRVLRRRDRLVSVPGEAACEGARVDGLRGGVCGRDVAGVPADVLPPRGDGGGTRRAPLLERGLFRRPRVRTRRSGRDSVCRLAPRPLRREEGVRRPGRRREGEGSQ
ncbi:hypothetical protein C8035_v006756 [Colletotrichum spinosum]|uniref:Uncharacterized protein n=1 Tax=Colletotrichum spinosum TaxID=1347390 RepID=A0A4R8QP05_9PEZI|nr:hypothetical protein C8035_v006756 [Colletotrichum spinosum]